MLPQASKPAGEQVGGDVTRGAVPLGMLEHVPTLPDRLQLRQPSVQAVSQQTPSTQNPLVQSVPTVHWSPVVSLSPHFLVIELHVRVPVQSD